MAAKLLAVEAKLFHVHPFARRMRQADRDEVLASDGMKPAQVLHACLRKSAFSRAVFVGDEPLAIFGVVELKGGIAQPWCLTTHAVDRYPLSFWKASKLVVRQFAKLFPAMVQCIDARHEKALRWVVRLGFTVEEQPHLCGVGKLPFHRATLITQPPIGATNG